MVKNLRWRSISECSQDNVLPTTKFVNVKIWKRISRTEFLARSSRRKPASESTWWQSFDFMQPVIFYLFRWSQVYQYAVIFGCPRYNEILYNTGRLLYTYRLCGKSVLFLNLIAPSAAIYCAAYNIHYQPQISQHFFKSRRILYQRDVNHHLIVATPSSIHGEDF